MSEPLRILACCKVILRKICHGGQADKARLVPTIEGWN